TTWVNLRRDRKAAIEDPGLGRLRNRDDSEEQAHQLLRGREDLEPGEPETRSALYQARAHLVLQADESHGHRCRRRRQRRAGYQSFLPSELRHPPPRWGHLDSRGA